MIKIFLIPRSASYSFLLLFAVLLSSPIGAQTDDIAVTNALEKGDATALAEHFQPELWICIKEFENNLSNNEAAIRLERFFDDHPVIGFERLHNGGSANSANEVVIGKLTTDNGEYRVYVYLSGDALKRIDELRIEN